METGERFESWAVVEVMGHTMFAGWVTEQVIGGCPFVRVDVPAVETASGAQRLGFTQLLGQGAIYSITPCSEEVARLTQARNGHKALNVYMPELYPPAEERRQLTAAVDRDAFFGDDEDSQ